MFAYVKNLSASGDEAFYQVHTSRIFHFLNGRARVKFDPEKHDASVSYGIVIGHNLVKHQVLILADTAAELTEEVAASTTSKLRSVPCPKRLSLGPLCLPLRQVKLLKGEAAADNSAAREAETLKRSAKIMDQMLSNSGKDGADDTAEALVPKKRKKNVPDPAKAGPSGVSSKGKGPSRVNPGGSGKGAGKEMIMNEASSDVAVNSVPLQVSDTVQAAECSGSQSVYTVTPSSDNETACAKVKELEQQLEVACRELEVYRHKCLEGKTQHNNSVEEKLLRLEEAAEDIQQKMELVMKDIADIKGFIQHARERANEKRSGNSKKPCKLSSLGDLAPHSSDYTVPDDEVHMGDGKYFINKMNLVVAEKANGLRPRFKRLLSFMYKGDINTVYNKKAKGAAQVLEVTGQHIQSFIGVLQAMEWKGKVPELTFEHISRELSKSLTELKNENFPSYQEEVDAYVTKKHLKAPSKEVSLPQDEGGRGAAGDDVTTNEVNTTISVPTPSGLLTSSVAPEKPLHEGGPVAEQQEQDDLNKTFTEEVLSDLEP